MPEKRRKRFAFVPPPVLGEMVTFYAETYGLSPSRILTAAMYTAMANPVQFIDSIKRLGGRET